MRWKVRKVCYPTVSLAPVRVVLYVTWLIGIVMLIVGSFAITGQREWVRSAFLPNAGERWFEVGQSWMLAGSILTGATLIAFSIVYACGSRPPEPLAKQRHAEPIERAPPATQ